MLQFLEKTHLSIDKHHHIKYRPEKTYGNSYQSPTQFQNKYSIINHQSYLNPFLKYDHNLGCLSAERHNKSVQPNWTRKINLSNLQTAKIDLTDTPKLKPLKQIGSHYERYHQEIVTNPLRFRLVKGEFTQYLNKNHHYQSIGPLQGTERSLDRVQVTKSTIKRRRQDKIKQLTISNRLKTTLYNTIKSNCLQNSSLLSYKNRIKQNRDVINNHFKKDIQKRHQKSNYSFNLPNYESKLDAVLVPQHKKRYKTQSSYK